eukprot:gene15753-33262_t
MRVLVIEDEAKIADYVKRGLSEAGYTVDVARDGIEGRYLALEGDYQLVVLDIMLPGIDGFGVLSALRQKRGTPVLMLTARDRVEDRVQGLEAGADDYLVKPFAFSELLARVGALLRRGPAATDTSNTRMAVCDLEMDLLGRKAWRAGQRLDLTAKEFSLLALLARRKGQILSRTTIAEQVWDMNFDSDTNVVEVAVRRLRSKMDDPFKPKLLHNVRGAGVSAAATPAKTPCGYSIGRRLSLLLATQTVIGLGVLLAIIYGATTMLFSAKHEEELRSYTAVLVDVVREADAKGGEAEVKAKLAWLAERRPGTFVQVNRADGSELYRDNAPTFDVANSASRAMPFAVQSASNTGLLQ